MTEEPGRPRTDHLRVIAISHRTAALEVLEQVSLAPDAARQLVRHLLSHGLEAVALSTCHRTELYWESRHPLHDTLAERALRGTIPGSPASLDPVGYAERLRGPAVTRHLLRVAAGLESVLVGEAEILGQVRTAFEIAHAAGTRAPGLVELFRDGQRFGRLARARTRIGAGALSVASAAVQLLRRSLGEPETKPKGDLSGRTILVVGAGEVGQKVLRHLMAERVRACIVLNRTLSRAEAAASQTGAMAAPLDELPARLATADAVIVAAQTETPLLTVEVVRRALEGRDAPLVIMDASMPRAVDRSIAALAGVELVDLSGLEALVHENRLRRETEIPRVEALLEELMQAAERREQRRLAWLSQRVVEKRLG